MTLETQPSREEQFVSSLFRLGSGPRAELKRALQQEDPGRHTAIFRYVEPFVPRDGRYGGRDAYYLVAALFGLVEKDDTREDSRVSLAKAVRQYELGGEAGGDEVSATEKRFLALLDADDDELPHRLRQMVKMVTSGSNRVHQQLDWQKLLTDLTRWNHPARRTQTDWAREFYNTQDQNQAEEETP